MNFTEFNNLLQNDDDFSSNFLKIQANILENIYNYQQNGAFNDLSST